MDEDVDESHCFLNSTDLTLRFEISNCLSIMEFLHNIDLNLCTITSFTLHIEENSTNQGNENDEQQISYEQNLFFIEKSVQNQLFPFQQSSIEFKEKQLEMISHQAEQLVGLQRVREDGLISNQLFGNIRTKSISLSPEPLNSRSSVKTDQSLMRFSHYNRKSNSQLNHSFDNNQSQSFNFSQHVSYLQKNTPVNRFRNYGKFQSNTQISQSQKLSESQFSINQSKNRYENAEILEQNTQSQILQSKQTFRRASSPKFKLVVKQPKKNKKSEIIEITLPKEAKKFEVVSTSQNKCNLVGSQTNNISAQYSRLSKDQSERSPYSKPFENKKYSEISLMVPKSKPFDSSILYKSNKSKKMNQSDIKLQSYDDDERLVETKDTRFHQTIKNFRNSSSLSDEREQSEPEQPTHFIDLQQLLQEKQKQKFQTQQFDRREQFSFKPSETIQEQLPKHIQTQNSQQEVLPFYTKKQPVQINLNIKQFVNNSESSERTTSSQTLTNNQNQNLSTLTFGKKK